MLRTELVLMIFFSTYAGFETKAQIIIAMEYLPNGELFDYVWKHQGLEEPEARDLFAQIVEGVHYCHMVRPSTHAQHLTCTLTHPSDRF